MLDQENYANGQKVHEVVKSKLTCFFKTGKVKAEGRLENILMEGVWNFYRERGQLWQVGNFKNGTWVRYDKNEQVAYQETFVDDKIV